MQLDLAGKHALVCGASQGIGRASAIELAALGASVTVLARSRDKLQQVVATLPCTHDDQHHDFIDVDMSDTSALHEMVTTRLSTHPAQILVNNTGGPPGGLAHQADADDYLQALRQHLVAGQTLLQAVLPGMREAGYGRLVNIISTSVKEPIPGLGVSNTTRAAMAGWAKTLSGELAGDGITVNNVLPGYTRTGRLTGLITGKAEKSGQHEDAVSRAMLAGVPVGRFGEADEVAAVVAFLCSPAAGYVNGVSIPVDGGRTRALA